MEAALARTPAPSVTRLRLLVARATIAYGVGERARLVAASGDTDLMPLLDGLAGEAYLVAGRLDEQRLEGDAAWTIEAVGVCLIALGVASDGVMLIGAAEAATERLGEPGRPQLTIDQRDRGLARAREQLGGAEVDARLERGRLMARDIATGLVLRAPTIVRRDTG